MYKISENLTILNIGHKKRDHHCSPAHNKMAASAWPGGGETAAADENKFCSTVQNKSWHTHVAHELKFQVGVELFIVPSEL